MHYKLNSLFYFTILGSLNSLTYLFFNYVLLKLILNHEIDSNVISLISSTISTTLIFYFNYLIWISLSEKYKLTNSSFYNILGLIIGTMFVIIGYIIANK